MVRVGPWLSSGAVCSMIEKLTRAALWPIEVNASPLLGDQLARGSG